MGKDALVYRFSGIRFGVIGPSEEILEARTSYDLIIVKDLISSLRRPIAWGRLTTEDSLGEKWVLTRELFFLYRWFVLRDELISCQHVVPYKFSLDQTSHSVVAKYLRTHDSSVRDRLA